MATLERRVRTVFETRGLREQAREARLTKSAFSAMHREVSGINRTLRRAGAALLTGFLGREAVRRLVGFNSDLATTKIALAAVLDMNTRIGKEAALGEAEKSMGRLRAMAKANVGEFQDFLTVFQLAQNAVFGAGGDILAAENIANLGVPAGLSLDIDTEQFGRDIAMILEGRAGANVKTFVKLAGAIGMTAEEFNKMEAPERLAKVVGALESFEPFVDEFARSLDGRLGTLSDTLQELVGRAGEPLYEAVLEAVKDINYWLEKNLDTAEGWADAIGEDLVNAFDLVIESMKWIFDHREELLGWAKAMAVAFAGWKIAGLVSSLAKLGAAGLAGLGSAGVIGGGGAAAGGSALAGTAAAGGGTAGAGLLAAAGPIGAAIGLGFVGVMAARADIAENTARKLGIVADAMVSNTARAESLVGAATSGDMSVDAAKSRLRASLREEVGSLERFSEDFADAIGMDRTVEPEIKRIVNEAFAEVDDMEREKYLADTFGGFFGKLIGANAPEQDMSRLKNEDVKAAKKKGTTTIKIDMSVNENPDRVITRLFDEFKKEERIRSSPLAALAI